MAVTDLLVNAYRLLNTNGGGDVVHVRKGRLFSLLSGKGACFSPIAHSRLFYCSSLLTRSQSTGRRSANAAL